MAIQIGDFVSWCGSVNVFRVIVVDGDFCQIETLGKDFRYWVFAVDLVVE